MNFTQFVSRCVSSAVSDVRPVIGLVMTNYCNDKDNTPVTFRIRQTPYMVNLSLCAVSEIETNYLPIHN